MQKFNTYEYLVVKGLLQCWQIQVGLTLLGILFFLVEVLGSSGRGRDVFYSAFSFMLNTVDSVL